MDGNHYIEEIEKYINSLKLQVESERKEIDDSQKKFSNLLKDFSQKAPSNSVINSLFKDEEPNGFLFNKSEEKRKHLAEQRKAEYNSYLEKKEAELLAKKRSYQERQNITPKSILDSVDYEEVLAKRKEEEAKFRDINLADILHSNKPILNQTVKKPELGSVRRPESIPTFSRGNGVNLIPVNLPGSTIGTEDLNSKFALAEANKRLAAVEAENSRLLEDRIAKHLEDQRRQMLLEFENELRKNNKIREEIQNLQTTAHSVQSSPKRVTPRVQEREDFPKTFRTGGGGEPVRDSFGNLITNRGAKQDSSSDYKSIMSFPSMQQQPIQDRMALYREELQRQIEEKKHLEALEKAKARDLEDKIAQRIEEQRLKMQEEYERELQKNNKIKEEFQRQQERIRKLQEFQRKDAEERRKKLLEAKPPEREKVPSQNGFVQERSQSPPIPAVRTKVLLEKAVPPVSAKTEVKPENVFSSLAEIRRQIMQEQQKPKDFKKSYEIMNRRTVQEVSDDDDDDDYLRSFKYSD